MSSTFSKEYFNRNLTFGKHFIPYRKNFSRCLYETFKYFILSFIYLSDKTLTSVSIFSSKKKSVSSISYFFNQGKWNQEEVNRSRLAVLENNKKTRSRSSDLICLDGSSLEKKGSSFEFVHRTYDEVQKKVVSGYTFLATGNVSKRGFKHVLRYSLDSVKLPSRKSFPVEVIELLRKTFKTCRAKLVVMDSGFQNKYLLSFILKQKREFLIRVRPNMVLWIDTSKGLKKKKMREISSRRKPTLFQELSGKKLRIWTIKGLVNAWQDTIKRNLTIIAIQKDGFRRRMYLATSLSLEESAPEDIYQAYQDRWKIEEIFSELKEQFGLEVFRVRSFKAILRYLTLVVVAHTILSYKCWKIQGYPALRENVLSILNDFRKITKLMLPGLKKFYEMMSQRDIFDFPCPFSLALAPNPPPRG